MKKFLLFVTVLNIFAVSRRVTFIDTDLPNRSIPLVPQAQNRANVNNSDSVALSSCDIDAIERIASTTAPAAIHNAISVVASIDSINFAVNAAISRIDSNSNSHHAPPDHDFCIEFVSFIESDSRDSDYCRFRAYASLRAAELYDIVVAGHCGSNLDVITANDRVIFSAASIFCFDFGCALKEYNIIVSDDSHNSASLDYALANICIRYMSFVEVIKYAGLVAARAINGDSTARIAAATETIDCVCNVTISAFRDTVNSFHGFSSVIG